MAFPAEARVGTSSSSRPFSLLETKSSVPNAGLSSVQKQVDGTVGSFADQAIDWKSMAAILAGTGAYRLSRMGIAGLGEGRMLRALSVGGGLAAEISAFETVHRSLHDNSNLWKWNGSGGLKNGLLSSLITFGALKGAGGLTRGENFLLQHASQDLAMVLGHQLAFVGGAGPKPQGSFAEQILEAEAVNLKLGAAMALLRRGSGEKDTPFEFLRPSSKPFFPSIFAAEQAPSREAALRSPWMLMVRDGEGTAPKPADKPVPVSREAKEEDLIRFAYEALEQWKTNPETPFDYGKFFLEAEMELSRKPLSEAQKQKVFRWYERKLSSHKASLFSLRNYGRNDVEREIRRYLGLSPDFRKQAVSLSHQYAKTFLFHSDDKPNMSDFALCGRGSCSARAKFVLSTGTAADLPLPKNLKWAVQKYHQHVESVLYDETGEKVWVFSSGRVRIVDQIDASLYHPAIYFHGFLKHMGVPSPVSERDLLLLEIPADPNAELEPITGGGDTPFELPFSAANFKAGETFRGHSIILPGPDFSWAPRRGIFLLLAGAGAAAFFLHRKQETPDPPKKDDPLPKSTEKPEADQNAAVLWADTQWTRPVTQLALLGQDPGRQIHYTGFYLPHGGGTILEKPEDVTAFNRLSPSENKSDFLVKVAERKRASSDFQKTLTFLSNPVQNLRNSSPEDLEDIAFYLNQIEKIHSSADAQLFRTFSSPDKSFPVYPLTMGLQSLSLEWSTFYYNLEIWKKWAQEHPKDLVSLINEMPLEKKAAALDFPFVLDAARLVTLQGRTRTSKTQKDQTPFDLDHGPKTIQTLIELDLSDLLPPALPPVVKPAAEPKPASVEESSTQSLIIVSPETALVFGLKTENLSTNLVENWNSDSTRIFHQLNKNGRHGLALFMTAMEVRKKNKSWQAPPALKPVLDEITPQRPPKTEMDPFPERVESLMKDFLRQSSLPTIPAPPMMKVDESK